MFKSKDVTESLMEKWVKTFENWEICDSFSMGLFSKSKFACEKILEWTARKPEFEKRAGFAIMASYCMADKKDMKGIKILMVTVLLVSLCEFSCKNTSGKTSGLKTIKIENKDKTYSENISYFEFKPDSVPNLKLIDFDIESAYQLGLKKIVTGYDQKVNPDSGKDWGNKLLLLNSENEILFKSKGVGDVYLFEPHFYKNVKTEKIIIVCQLAYEYYFGGEAFLFENGKVRYIGNLDIEGANEESRITDIVEINEKDNLLLFTFKSDSLYLKPGLEDILIENTEVTYLYKDNELVLENAQVKK